MKPTTKRLALSRTTLRMINGSDLAAAQGAGYLYAAIDPKNQPIYVPPAGIPNQQIIANTLASNQPGSWCGCQSQLSPC